MYSFKKNQETMNRSIQLPYQVFTDRSIFRMCFSFVKERQFRLSDAMTSNQFLVIGYGAPTGVSFMKNSI